MTRFLRWLGPVLFLASAFAACSDSGEGPRASGGGAALDAAPDRVNSSGGVGGKPNLDLIFDAAGQDVSEPDPDARPDPGDQPVVACSTEGGAVDGDADADTGDTGTSMECRPPPSRCADARFLVYYLDGRCVDGRCHWREEFYRCRASCGGNGCNDNFTAPAAK